MKRLLILICIVTFLISGCGNENKIRTINNSNDTDTVHTTDTQQYTIELVKEDIEYFKDTYLKMHPGFKNPIIKKEFLERYANIVESIDKPMTKQELFFELSQLIVPLEDGHAIIRYADEKFFLPVQFRWLEEGLVVINSKCDLEKGDKILQINDKQPDDLLNELKNIISSENIYWVKVRASEMLREKYILNYLGCVDGYNSTSIKIQKPDGSIKTHTVYLSSGLKAYMSSQTSTTPYYKELKDYNAAVLVVPKCENNALYKSTLNKFFQYVRDNGISRIVVDLRDNSGGDSRVLDEFLKYVDINEVDYFYDHTSYKLIKKIEHQNDWLYNGKIYIATSNNTFSSAVLFAGVIKYNGIGLTIGEPTGNATIRYGYSNRYTLPNTRLEYIVTSRRWILPNTGYKPTVEPDIFLPCKIENIINETDPIVEWLKLNN